MNYQPVYAKSLALLVGINKYRYAPPLARACEDASSVAEVLSSQLGFPKTDVTVLLDEEATRHKIMERFLGYGTLSLNDRVFVFFAGHRRYDTRSARRHWLPCSGRWGSKRQKHAHPVARIDRRGRNDPCKACAFCNGCLLQRPSHSARRQSGGGSGLSVTCCSEFRDR